MNNVSVEYCNEDGGVARDIYNPPITDKLLSMVQRDVRDAGYAYAWVDDGDVCYVVYPDFWELFQE